MRAKGRLGFWIWIVAALAGGCAQTDYQPFEARNPFMEGQGGTRRTVDGIDIWENGTPPRRYEILGVFSVSVNEGIGRAGIVRGRVAQRTRRVGGDAAIRVGSDSSVQGAVMMGNFVIPARGRTDQFLIIRYADFPNAPAASNQPATIR